MDADHLLRGAGVLGTCYIKRWLKSRYDQLADLPAVAKLRSLSPGSKMGVEAILYTLTAYAEQRLTDQSPLGLMAKSILMDAAPEIASRLMVDVRADLTRESSGPRASEPSGPEIARKLLAMDNKALLGLLVGLEEMDDEMYKRFLSFAASANPEDLEKFGSLPPEQRAKLLKVHGLHDSRPVGGWGSAFRSFAKDFAEVFKAWSQKTYDVSLPALNRYMAVLLWVLKVSGVLWGMAFLVCTASTLCGRWALFAVFLGLTGAGVGGVLYARRSRHSWLLVASGYSVLITAILAFLCSAGYPDSCFGVAVLFLVGAPLFAIGTLLIPITAVFEILRALFPSGYRTLMSAAQMLLSAFLGFVFFAVALLLFPPQNPVAFLFMAPLVIALALGAGFGLVRTRPSMFLRTPVLLGIAGVIMLALGVMSMPNLRNKLRTLPLRVDRALATAPIPLDFASSRDIGFVTVDGDVKVWYAERLEGGYDLYRCEGTGPYYTPDGRSLKKADSDSIRRQIMVWADRVVVERAEEAKKAEEVRVAKAEEARIAEEKRKAEEAEAQRKAEEARIAREQEAIVVEQKRKADELAKVEQERRASYLQVTNLAAKVDYLIVAVIAGKKPLPSFSAQLGKQIQQSGRSSSLSVFSPTFVEEGGFDLFFSGKGGDDTRAMGLSRMADKLMLARCDEITTKASLTVSRLFHADIRMTIHVLDAADGKILKEFPLSGVGPGTNESSAEEAAYERILEQVKNLQL